MRWGQASGEAAVIVGIGLVDALCRIGHGVREHGEPAAEPASDAHTVGQLRRGRL